MTTVQSAIAAVCAVLLLGLTAALPSHAQTTLSGEVLVGGQDEASVNKALGEILAEILTSAAQDPSAVSAPAAQEAIGSARDFVQTYTFRQQLALVDGQPARQLYLNASFDRRTIQSLLKQGGVTAVPTNAANAEVAMLIYGIRSSADYARVLSYLGQVPVVRRVQVDAADRDRLALRAQVSGAADGLIASVTDGGVLTWLTVAADGRVEFELQQ